RRLLEAGDLRPRQRYGAHAAASLARRFRSLRIGWGRQKFPEGTYSAHAVDDRLWPFAAETSSMYSLLECLLCARKADVDGLRRESAEIDP
ncbi:MAG: hypothetical protein R3268_12185, partial [Acidiferrobacterales bacterium]|nr:hypothetical protein [Acidiferrobacterales bacterium]